MSSFFEKKIWILSLSILSLIALMLLAVSLRDISFNEAQPIGQEKEALLVKSIQSLQGLFSAESTQSQVVVWMSLTVIVVLGSLFLLPEVRKRLLRIFIRLAALYWGLYLIFKQYPNLLSDIRLNAGSFADGTVSGDVGTPPVFTPPAETPLIVYLISVLIALFLIYLLWLVYRSWQDAHPKQRKPLNEIAQIAHASLRDLSSGRDSTDVILNCYFRMSDVVEDKKYMRRASSMTPAEFAIRLEQAGLPGDAVQRLTRLFEYVRYGKKRAGSGEVKEAIACLTAILQYCGETV